MSVARALLEELRRDEGLKRELAEEIVPEALRHKELRRVVLMSISREMATKEDLERLKEDLKSYVDARMNDLNARMNDLYGVVKASLVAIVVTLASTILAPLMLRLLLP
jgi:hypothetical protein